MVSLISLGSADIRWSETTGHSCHSMPSTYFKFRNGRLCQLTIFRPCAKFKFYKTQKQFSLVDGMCMQSLRIDGDNRCDRLRGQTDVRGTHRLSTSKMLKATSWTFSLPVHPATVRLDYYQIYKAGFYILIAAVIRFLNDKSLVCFRYLRARFRCLQSQVPSPAVNNGDS